MICYSTFFVWLIIPFQSWMYTPLEWSLREKREKSFNCRSSWGRWPPSLSSFTFLHFLPSQTFPSPLHFCSSPIPSNPSVLADFGGCLAVFVTCGRSTCIYLFCVVVFGAVISVWVCCGFLASTYIFYLRQLKSCNCSCSLVHWVICLVKGRLGSCILQFFPKQKLPIQKQNYAYPNSTHMRHV